eukprot:3932054-Rhodomonas_salina.1
MLDKVRRAPAGYIPPNRKRLFNPDAPPPQSDPKRPKPLPNTLHDAKKAVWGLFQTRLRQSVADG